MSSWIMYVWAAVDLVLSLAALFVSLAALRNGSAG